MAWYKYLSVEVPLLFSAFAMILQGAILTNLYVYRACYIILKYNESECAQLGNDNNDITKVLEPKVQPTVNYINMAHTAVNSLIPLVFSLFVGTWSDKFGRRPFMLFSLVGTMLTTVLNTLIIHFENLSPWWFTLSGIPSLLSGGPGTLLIVISAFLTDVTTDENRVIRLTLFEVIVASSSVLGNLMSSYVFYATSYQTIYIIATCLTGISVVYTFFFIPESLKGEKQPLNIKEMILSINIKDIFKDVLRKRDDNARKYIFIILGINLISGLGEGEMAIGRLYLRAKLGWTLTKLTTVSSIMSLGMILGTLCGTYLLYRALKIKEIGLCIFGNFLMSIAHILRGIATNDYYIYAANALTIFAGLPSLMLKTLLSLMITPEERGKIFAVTTIISSLDHMVSSIMFPAIYNATLETNSGIFNFVSLAINLTVIIIYSFLLRVKFPSYTPSSEEGVQTEKKNEIAELEFHKRMSLEILDVQRLSLPPGI